ncbi:MAG TPA: gamma-glutamyltransferase, partial [Gammaproteobacteria bacterium]|nr:gamma-glutamyltransferase [Gammaproteobacteria bacterium]
AAGAVAAGHPLTADAATQVLAEGGNAFDAVVAAHWCACVAEPVLTSPGGGGFLLARAAGAPPRLYDFFTHTPRHPRPPADIDFHPIHADFGATTQEFHIGWGAIATPGTVRGLFDIQRELCTLPMAALMAPAIEHARNGVRINALQAYIFDVVRPIYLTSETARRRFASRNDPGQLVGEGETLYQPELADSLEALAREGDALFYEGDIAHQIVTACREQGGHLQADDLAAYRTRRRQPLQIRYRDAMLYTNPPPSSGGLLIGFALRLLDAAPLPDEPWRRLELLARVMAAANEARLEHAIETGGDALLDDELVATWRSRVDGRARARRGTTHISVIDAAGNVASLTASNGEGCGHMPGDTGIMLNNMLGEEDLNPGGFHRWRPDSRLTSMMAPSLLVRGDGSDVALGSGGSNRIRSALLQVLTHLVDDGLDLQAAVDRPRIHYEAGRLHLEEGFDAAVVEALQARFDEVQCWPGRNLYFGGVHAVARRGRDFACAGDGRRGGVAGIAKRLQ